MQKGQMITMSCKESERIAVIQQTSERSLSQAEAAKRLHISDRQVKRLVKRFREDGAAGLVSRKRGKPSNNHLCPKLKEMALGLIREHYWDFGPTFACEKLKEKHQLKVSRETLRHWMIGAEIWSPKRRKKLNIHHTRERRACLGDMIQIDGSPHHWFENRGPYCTLIVWIDDATSQLMKLRFMPSETTYGYLDVLRDYIETYGAPVSLYSDKHSIFRQNMNDGEGDETQFTQALRRLDIEPIHANTPQAKGRVERANKTLQDRLIKEMRLRGIATIEAANDFMDEFIIDYNSRFAKPARAPQNSHRQLELSAQDLKLHCATHRTRVLSKNLTVQYNNTEYQLDSMHHKHRLRGKKVTVIETSNGEVSLLFEGTLLEYRTIAVGAPVIPLDDEKTVAQRVEEAKRKQKANVRLSCKPKPNNPFNKTPINPHKARFKAS